MINYTAIPSPYFEKELSKLSVIDQSLVLKKIKTLESNPFYPSLRTRRVEGTTDAYESSVNMDIRLIWKFEENRIIYMLDVGHHDVLKKY